MLISDDFSALIVTRANDPKRLDYVIKRIRKFYPTLEIVIIFDKVPSTLSNADKYIVQIETQDRVYVSGGYNLALKNSSKPYFVFLHDDTIISNNFIENIIPYINETTFGNFITIEPPKYGNEDSELRPIKDFGLDIDSFNETAFDDFCLSRSLSLKNKSAPSQYGGFFLSGSKNSIMKIGGFDEQFRPFFNEDSDLMVRMILYGYKFVYCLDSCVYHMVSMTSRVDENEVLLSAQQTSKIFTKKWGTTFDALKLQTINYGIPYKKPNLKLEGSNYDKTNPYHKFVKNFFNYDKTKPHSIVMLDFNKLCKSDMEMLMVMPYIIMANTHQDVIRVSNFKVLIDPESLIPINLVANI